MIRPSGVGRRWYGTVIVRTIAVVLLSMVVACGDDDDASPPASFLDPADVSELADDRLAGRDNLTEGSQLARDYLIGVLREMAVGLDASASGDDAFLQVFAQGTNVLAVIPGGELADEYVMVGAHYDHVSIGQCAAVQPDDDVCNGATDNATGVAVALAVARAVDALPEPPRRSLIIALWDTEEDGLVGSRYYANNPVVPLADTIAYINLDIQGSNMSPGLRPFTFAVGAETGGAALTGMVRNAITGAALNVELLSYIFGQLRSDYVNLANAGVPTVFFTDANGPCYHTNGDELETVDFPKLETQTSIAIDLAMELIETDDAPPFTAPSTLPAATYEDAEAVSRAINAAAQDVDLLEPDDQEQLLEFQSDLNEVVAAGPDEFGPEDIGPLLTGTAAAIEILRRVECDGYLE